MRAGIVIGKPEGIETALRAEEAFRREGATCRVGEKQARELGDGFYAGLDVVLSIGGDGTILMCAQHAAPLGIPVLGVNLGRLGFLTEVEPDAVEDAAGKVMRGDYRIEKRMMLKATIRGETHFALNEVLLEGMQRGRLMWFEQVVDDGEPDRIACDGVMVSSPTGSTAYSLSCGGPILAPELDAMVIATVCPHTLRSRPLVVHPDSSVIVRAGEASSALYADGQPRGVVEPGEEIVVSRAPFSFKMIRFARGDFYNVVRNKLSEWSYL